MSKSNSLLNNKIKKAMILAGGEGTRLRPLTYILPKPLVYVVNRPSIEYIIKFLYDFGIKEFAINISYKAELMEEYVQTRFKKEFKDCSLYILKEKNLSGTAGPVKKLKDFFKDDNFIVIGCDDIFDFDLNYLIESHIKNENIATIALYKVDDPSQFGVAVIDDNNNIINFQEKPKENPISYLANTGVYIFSPKIFDYILSEDYYDFGTQVFYNLLEDKAKFQGINITNKPFNLKYSFWVDIGNIKTYFEANKKLIELKHPFIKSRIIKTLNSTLVLDENVEINSNTVVNGFAIIGKNCKVSGYISNSIIWPNNTINNSYLENSIITHTSNNNNISFFD